MLIAGVETNIYEEIKLSEHVSEEEWETIKPSRSDRRESIITYMKVNFLYVYGFFVSSVCC